MSHKKEENKERFWKERLLLVAESIALSPFLPPFHLPGEWENSISYMSPDKWDEVEYREWGLFPSCDFWRLTIYYSMGGSREHSTSQVATESSTGRPTQRRFLRVCCWQGPNVDTVIFLSFCNREGQSKAAQGDTDKCLNQDHTCQTKPDWVRGSLSLPTAHHMSRYFFPSCHPTYKQAWKWHQEYRDAK